MAGELQLKIIKSLRLWFLTCFFFMTFSLTVQASPLFILEPDQHVYHLSPHLEILEDEHQELTIKEITSGQYDDLFLPFNGDVPNYGYTDSAFWVKLTIQNEAGLNNWLLQISYPPLDHVHLFSPDGDGNYTVIETGDLQPFSSRIIPHRDFVFRLNLPDDSLQTYYLYIDTQGSSQLPITLTTGDSFHSKSLFEYFILGIYFGLGLIMVFYNLFLFYSLRVTSYLWYTILVIFILGSHFTLNGLSYQYLWPEASWWNNRAILFFMAAGNTTVLMFAKSFLNTRVFTPIVNRIINFAVIIHLILIGILFFNYQLALNLIILMMFIVVLLLIITSIISWKNGIKPAKYFFFGWLMFFFGITLSSSADMGLIPINFYTRYASQIGSGVEIVLFSLALAAKIKWLRLEKNTLEKQALQSQHLAVKHLQQANRLKDEFLANTSHELRTPLQGIIGITESVLSQEKLSEEAQFELSLIKQSGEKLTHLINDLLDASKLKYQELSLNLIPIQLWQLAEVVCQVSAATHDKPILIKNNISQDLPLVAADELRLQQILYNLISNALKYTHKGSVELSAEEKDSQIVVFVRDTGIGISEKDLAAIFDSFKRGNNIDEMEVTGTGLGLYITRQLVELHQGEIFIETHLNKGTTVSFSIPIHVDVKKHEEEKTKEKLAKIPVQFHLNSDFDSHGKILIVDDESLNIHVLFNHLTYANYETVIANDGEEALEKLAIATFDLVILDVMLPKLSGYQVAMKIRETYTLSELPILMLTAKSQTEDILTAFQSGANDYLIKPYAKEELLARVNTLLTLKIMMQELTEVNTELQVLNQSLESKVEIRTADLQEKTHELEQINSSRKRLMTNISHELGTPMTSIKGYIKAMLDGIIQSDDEKYITLVYQKILFIERQIQDLYELARLESRQLSFNWENISIETFITTCIWRYKIDIEANAVNYIFEDELTPLEKNLQLQVDLDRMQQVMQNLISNAIRFLKDDGTLTIRAKIMEEQHVNSEEKQLYLQISICDDGIGMEEETVERVFERFYQKEKDEYKEINTNSGLGLTIAKEIITYHHGRIWAESVYGSGSQFYYQIPIMR